MSCTLGIDVSSYAIDLVLLDESEDRAEHTRIALHGETAFDRLRDVQIPRGSWWDGVYLAAIEMPESRFRKSLRAILPIFGAVVALIPADVETWPVAPADWKPPLGVANTAKPTVDSFPGFELVGGAGWPQDAFDALGVARFARDLNAAGIAKTLGKVA